MDLLVYIALSGLEIQLRPQDDLLRTVRAEYLTGERRNIYAKANLLVGSD